MYVFATEIEEMHAFYLEVKEGIRLSWLLGDNNAVPYTILVYFNLVTMELTGNAP